MSLATSLEEIQLGIEILQSSLLSQSSTHFSSSVLEVSNVFPNGSDSHSLIHKVVSFLEDAGEDSAKLNDFGPSLPANRDRLFLENSFRRELEKILFSSPAVARGVSLPEEGFSPLSSSSKCNSVNVGHESNRNAAFLSPEGKIGHNSADYCSSWQFGIHEKPVEEKELKHARGVERAACIALNLLRSKTK